MRLPHDGIDLNLKVTSSQETGTINGWDVRINSNGTFSMEKEIKGLKVEVRTKWFYTDNQNTPSNNTKEAKALIREILRLEAKLS